MAKKPLRNAKMLKKFLVATVPFWATVSRMLIKEPKRRPKKKPTN